MKRKIILITLISSLFIIASLIGILFIKNVNGNSQDIEYIFNNDYIFNSDNLDTFNFNIKNKSEYTEHYNASYSFENDIINSIPNGWNGNNLGGIINNFNKHNKVLLLIGNNIDYSSFYTNIHKNNGTIEFWFAVNNSVKDFSLIIKENTEIGIWLKISSNMFIIFYSESFKGISININQWYHVKIEFNCTSDKQSYWINNNLELDNQNFYLDKNINSLTLLDLICASDVEKVYFDAIGYSWDNDYTIGQNFIPYLEINPNIQEVDKCEFAYNLTTSEPNGLDVKNIDNNWNEYDDSTNSHVKTSGIKHSIVIDYFATQLQDYYGIYKEFNYNNEGIFNITFDITSMDLFNPHLDGWYFNIYSYDDTLLVSLLFNLTTPPDISLYYYNGSSYIFIHEVLSLLGNISFNIYIDNTWIILRLNDNDVIYTWFFSELTSNIGINTIKVIGGNNEDIGDYASVDIDSIGLYINGSSYLPNDLMSSIISTNINQWNDNIHNIFEIFAIGNFSFAIFYDGSIAYQLFSYSEFTTMKRIYAYELDVFKGNSPYTFVLISNTSFDITKISVYSNILKEGSNIYRPIFTYSNINISQNYFYVSNNRLYFTHYANENDTLEYIQAKFNIDNIYAINRSISFKTYFLGISKAYFKTNYVSNTNSTFSFRLGYETISKILPQQQIIKSFTILITDNNDNDYYGNSEGYISSIKLRYYPDIELIILTLSLVEIMIPLVVLIIPTLAIASVYGKKAIIPMLILMTVICFIANLIQPEIFFIMMLCLGSALFLQYKKEREKI